jgi:hypothetical protein
MLLQLLLLKLGPSFEGTRRATGSDGVLALWCVCAYLLLLQV